MPDPVQSIDKSMVGAAFKSLDPEPGEPADPRSTDPQDAANAAAGFDEAEEKPVLAVVADKPDGTALIAASEKLMGFAVRNMARKRRLEGSGVDALCAFDKEERAILSMVAPGAEEFLGVADLTPQQAAIAFGLALAFVTMTRIYTLALIPTPKSPAKRKADDKAAAKAKDEHEERWGGNPPSTLEVGYVPETVGFHPRFVPGTTPAGGVEWAPPGAAE